MFLLFNFLANHQKLAVKSKTVKTYFLNLNRLKSSGELIGDTMIPDYFYDSVIY